MKTAIILMILALVSGCASIEYARSVRDAKTLPGGERPISLQEVGLGDGSPLTLEHGLEIALKFNPAVTISRSQAQAAEARLQQVNAGFQPQISVSENAHLQQSKTDNMPVLVSNSRTPKTQGGNVAVNQLIFDFGKTDASSRQAFKEFIAAQSDLKATENNIVFNFKQAFLNVLKQQELVYVAEESVRQFEKRLEQVQGFFQVGTRLRYDVTTAEVDLGNARLNLVTAKTTLTVNQAILNNVLGFAQDTKYIVSSPKVSEEEFANIDDLFNNARQNHPQLLAQQFRVQAAQYAIDVAIADYFPSLSLQGSFGWSSTQSISTWTWFTGPLINLLSWSEAQKSGRLKEVIANLIQERATLAQLEEQTFLDIRQSFTQLTDARERVKIANLVVKQAEEQSELVQGRYAIGKATSVELTDAEVSLINARSAQIQAQFDIQIATAALKKAIGVMN